MNLKLFTNDKFGSVRIVEIESQPWFVGKDVADILGYQNSSKALTDHVDIEDKLNNKSLSSLGQRGGWLINESGLYSLVLSSKMPTAKQFKRWITSEVLPSIRQHGAYMTDEALEQALLSPDFLIRLAGELKAEKEARAAAEKTIAEQHPKVLFSDAVAASHSSVLVGELAKIIKQNGVDMGQNRLFARMRDNGYLIRRNGTDYNMPTQRAMELGLFEVKISTITNPDGSIRETKTTKVTGKGQIYFVNKLCGSGGIVA